MLKSFLNFSQHHQLTSSSPILIGVSGGRDSVVLCDLYHLAKIDFAIAHCNFGLRAEESNEDEKFVIQLAKKYQVPLFRTKIPTKAYAEESGISIQMSARAQRVNWFKKLCKENEFEYYATAHHSDDAIETYFINQIRGTGISGLHGILPKQGTLIHPLLFASREDITQHAEVNNLSWREDSSNAKTKYLRNKIRHQVLPLLQEINGGVKQTIIENMGRFYETEQIYLQKIEELKKELLLKTKEGWSIPLETLRSHAQATTILYEFLKEFGFNYSQCKQVLQENEFSQVGALFYSSSYQLLRDRKYLLLKETISDDVQEYDIKSTSSPIETPIKLKIESSENTDIIADKNIAKLDADLIEFPLKIRKWKQGDYFYPLGMKGQKKLVSDFFIDHKMSLFEKQNTWVLCSKNKIVWIIGHRIDNRFKISSQTSKTIIISTLPTDC
ncbi:tRNA lysidine(34) synthetase TilS [Lentimicrobium sp. S6]|uniref:tRNA lysidine(34) synthetase TilS n=1 Tax=Lentimicrobium sp. S6 TaxID=2735872 RepID=UPI00155808E7|nr:tRNA lysidine(34) synthetase TilS [Lentimicrobium sp. S6]NPD46553.1 tRNA lysidine(34) synthetase TilS [Lentimicrobium sp. S6]